MTIAIAKTIKNPKPRVTFADYLTYFDGWYDVTEFYGDELIISPTFPEIQLTPQAIFL